MTFSSSQPFDFQLSPEQQAQQLRATLDASLNGIVAMTARRDETDQIVDFQITTINLAFERLTNTPAAKALGASLLTLFPGNVETGFFDAYRRVVLTGEPEQLTQYYNSGDLEAWFEVSAVRQGQEGVVVTFMDVTQSKLYEQRLQRSNQDLERFAYVASHDLQEPLRKIQTFSDLLQTSQAENLTGSGPDLLKRIQAAANRMQQLIKDLLAFSRFTNREMAFAPVLLHQITTEVLTDLEEEVRRQQARIDLGPLPVIAGDALQLRQLMQNLLTNALKFARPDQPPHIRVLARPATIHDKPKELRGQFVVIEVTDNGIGFEPAFRDKIFQLFQRLHGPDKYPGTGIGLAICQKVAENHGGQISAQSTPGQGTTFSVLLPVSAK
jgi:signal transduction histidine kinase